LRADGGVPDFAYNPEQLIVLRNSDAKVELVYEPLNLRDSFHIIILTENPYKYLFRL
jgi:hypothetical protein